MYECTRYGVLKTHLLNILRTQKYLVCFHYSLVVVQKYPQQYHHRLNQDQTHLHVIEVTAGFLYDHIGSAQIPIKQSVKNLILYWTVILL